MEEESDVSEVSIETIRLRGEVANLKRQKEALEEQQSRLVAGFGRREILREAEAGGAFNPAQFPALLGKVSSVWQGDMPETRIETEGVGPQTVRDAIAGLKKTAPNLFRDNLREEIRHPQTDRPAIGSQDDWRRHRASFGLTGRPGR